MTTPNLRESGQERLLSEAIAERRATPSFDGSPIPDEVLSAILRAGLEAPSGYNLQPWRFVVVRSTEQKRRLREAAMGQPKVEEAGAIIVCCGDPDAPRGQNLDTVLAEAVKHGFSEEENRKVREAVSSVFGKPAGNAMGVAPDWAVWVNRHVMIAFTTMMWRAEVLGYDTAPMEGFFEAQGEVGAQYPRLHPSGRSTGHRQAKRTRQTLCRPPRLAQCLLRRDMGRKHQSMSVGLLIRSHEFHAATAGAERAGDKERGESFATSQLGAIVIGQA